LARQLREAFQLSLMGADLLVEEETGHVYIIDVNYFSSYMDLPNLKVEEAFKELIVKTVQQ